MGATEAEFLAANPGFNCRSVPPDRICSPAKYGVLGDGSDTFGGHTSSRIDAIFMSDRLAQVAVGMPAPYFDDVVAALKEEFGAPTLVVESPRVQTKGGPTTENTVIRWKLNGGTVDAVRFGMSINESFVQYIGLAATGVEKRRQ